MTCVIGEDGLPNSTPHIKIESSSLWDSRQSDLLLKKALESYPKKTF
jgi:hypothetical protein